MSNTIQGVSTSTSSPRSDDLESVQPRVAVIVVGGGSGQRFGGLKQFESMGSDAGRVIDRSVEVAMNVCSHVVVVVPEAHQDAERSRFGRRYGERISVVGGGATRSGSVRAGLGALDSAVEIVCVHDAARPLASEDLYHRVIDAVVNGADGVVPALAVSDTIKVVDDDRWVVATPPRDRLVAVQTPQAFSAASLRRAHEHQPEGSDDAMVVEQMGGRVLAVEGERSNIKITHPDDLLVIDVPSGRAGAEREIET